MLPTFALSSNDILDEINADQSMMGKVSPYILTQELVYFSFARCFSCKLL